MLEFDRTWYFVEEGQTRTFDASRRHVEGLGSDRVFKHVAHGNPIKLLTL